jgi:hypothetical protein
MFIETENKLKFLHLLLFCNATSFPKPGLRLNLIWRTVQYKCPTKKIHFGNVAQHLYSNFSNLQNIGCKRRKGFDEMTVYRASQCRLISFLRRRLRFIPVDEWETSSLLLLPKIFRFRCHIWRSQGRGYGENVVLGRSATQFGDSLTFARNIRLHRQCRWESQARNQQKQTCFCWFSAWFTLNPENGGQFTFTEP